MRNDQPQQMLKHWNNAVVSLAQYWRESKLLGQWDRTGDPEPKTGTPGNSASAAKPPQVNWEQTFSQ